MGNHKIENVTKQNATHTHTQTKRLYDTTEPSCLLPALSPPLLDDSWSDRHNAPISTLPNDSFPTMDRNPWSASRRHTRLPRQKLHPDDPTSIQEGSHQRHPFLGVTNTTIFFVPGRARAHLFG